MDSSDIRYFYRDKLQYQGSGIWFRSCQTGFVLHLPLSMAERMVANLQKGVVALDVGDNLLPQTPLHHLIQGLAGVEDTLEDCLRTQDAVVVPRFWLNAVPHLQPHNRMTVTLPFCVMTVRCQGAKHKAARK